MKVSSFKFKIGLLNLLISGSVLLFFGLFFLSVINRVGYERIDRELRVLADLQARRPFQKGGWDYFEELLQNLYGEDAKKQFAIKVASHRGEPIYSSLCWPADVLAGKLPALALATNTMIAYDGAFPMRLRAPFDGYAPRHGPPLPWHIRGPVFATAEGNRGRWRIVGIGNEEVNIFIAMNLAIFDAEVHRFRSAFFIAMPLALLFLLCGGWLIAYQSLGPVKIIAGTAENITAKGLDRRIPKTDADKEFAGLIDVINGMLDRLEKNFQQAVRFSADAGHELKTPLTILQGQLERALNEASPGSEAQQRNGELLEEVQRLVAITQKLLLLAQADSGRMRLALAPFNLSSALESISEDMGIMAPGLILEKEIVPRLHVMADADLMNQVLHNLITNAIKYNRKQGWIRCVLQKEGNMVKFTISNSGEEIPQADADKVFDRFYRISKSRDREIDGIGLGLSLAREIVLAHKGELVLDSSRNGITTFILKLPLCSQPA
ncbi:MAG: ATP-binding protein [Kiritimatiellae bacterium]|nr:ATP-binding protein [Kiritimatiellia bacterium]